MALIAFAATGPAHATLYAEADLSLVAGSLPPASYGNEAGTGAVDLPGATQTDTGGSYQAVASGSASALATYGAVHAYASGATGVSWPSAPAWSACCSVAMPATATATGIAAFSDVLTFSGPPGTPVSLLVGYGLFGSVDLGDTDSNPDVPQASLDLQVAVGNLSAGLALAAPGGTAAARYVKVTGYAGEPLPISEELTADVSVQPPEPSSVSGPGTSREDAVADGSDTGLFSVEVLTPGITYTSESGTIYALQIEDGHAIPEPGSAAVLAFAIAALAAVPGLSGRRGTRA